MTGRQRRERESKRYRDKNQRSKEQKQYELPKNVPKMHSMIFVLDVSKPFFAMFVGCYQK